MARYRQFLFSKLIHPRNLTRKSDFAGILRAGHASDYKHVSVLLSQSPGARRCLLPARWSPAPPRSPLVRAVLSACTGIHLGTRCHPRLIPDLGRTTSGARINSMGERSAKASGARRPRLRRRRGGPTRGWWGWGQDAGGKGRGWGVRPRGAARQSAQLGNAALS